MANDAPTNLRMGFGFPEARAAGAPFIRPRSGHEMDWDVNERANTAALAALVRSDPSIEDLVRKILEESKIGYYWVGSGHGFKMTPEERGSATLLYYFILWAKPNLAPKGVLGTRAHEISLAGAATITTKISHRRLTRAKRPPRLFQA